jgi:hypothetical protein
MHMYAERHIAMRPVKIDEQQLQTCRSEDRMIGRTHLDAGDELCCATLQRGDGLAVANRLMSIGPLMEMIVQQIWQTQLVCSIHHTDVGQIRNGDHSKCHKIVMIDTRRSQGNLRTLSLKDLEVTRTCAFPIHHISCRATTTGFAAEYPP